MSGQVEISNAGHCPALWVHRGGVKRLAATGVPLGMFCDGLIATEKIRLAPGDTLLLYTYGVSEARSESDEEYGEERVCELLERSHALAPQALIHACLEDLAAFRGQTPLSDDLTLLAIRRTQ